MHAGEWRAEIVSLRITWWLGLLLAVSAIVQAERLPIRTYTTAEGLPRDQIMRIVPDSHGFLWFCTPDGLSRFDGYTFTNYGVEQGLPHPTINDLLETRSGVYWVATNGGGVCRLNPSQLRNADCGLRNERQEIRNPQSAMRVSAISLPLASINDTGV